MTEPVPVVVRSAGIRLGQFLKLADAIDQGSDAKFVLASGDVRVNGVQEVHVDASWRPETWSPCWEPTTWSRSTDRRSRD